MLCPSLQYTYHLKNVFGKIYAQRKNAIILVVTN